MIEVVVVVKVKVESEVEGGSRRFYLPATHHPRNSSVARVKPQSFIEGGTSSSVAYPSASQGARSEDASSGAELRAKLRERGFSRTCPREKNRHSKSR